VVFVVFSVSDTHLQPMIIFKEVNMKKRVVFKPIADNERSAGADRRSMAVGLIVFSLCILAAISGLIYKQRRHHAPSELPEIGYINEQTASTSIDLKLLDLVRKAPAKSPGSTIAQSLISYLNVKKGPNWQPVGWKHEAVAGQQNFTIVKFLWREQGIKEAAWQVNLTTHTIKAVNETAAHIGP